MSGGAACPDEPPTKADQPHTCRKASDLHRSSRTDCWRAAIGQPCKKRSAWCIITAREARLARDDWTPSQFGTAVHTIIAQKVNGLNPLTQKPRSPDEPADPNFRAEFSLLKALAEDPFAALPRYGQQGTIRIDVLENPENGTVCAYDIKTGRQPLTLARIKEIGEFVVQRYGSEKRIIIMEVRPR